MEPTLTFAILLGLVAFATALGLLWKATTGRARTGSGDVVRLAEVPVTDGLTLLQFSTEVCAPCSATRRVLGTIADEREDVAHVDLDITNRPELAARFNIMQTPTTLVLDSAGSIRARIGGAVRPDVIRAELDRISGVDRIGGVVAA